MKKYDVVCCFNTYTIASIGYCLYDLVTSIMFDKTFGLFLVSQVAAYSCNQYSNF